MGGSYVYARYPTRHGKRSVVIENATVVLGTGEIYLDINLELIQLLV